MTSSEIAAARPRVGWVDKTVLGWFDQWVRFWFTPCDPAPLGMLRIFVGGMLVYSHWVWGLDLAAFMGPDGWNSAEAMRLLQQGQWNQSFWWNVSSESMQLVHYWCMGILILFWLGCCTRITSIMAFVVHVSYCQRARMSNYGLDQIGGILLLYLMIGPSGAVYSVDSLFKRFWLGPRAASEAGIGVFPSIPRLASAGLSLRLIQVHYCIIYFFASTGKFQGEAWWTGDALWRAVSNYEYQSIDLTWLAWYPEVLQFMTHVVILWELSFAYLIWVRPLRPLMLAIGVLMHLGIGAFLGMWTFGLMMIFGYIAFLEPETVRAVVALPGKLLRKKAVGQDPISEAH